MASLNSVKVKSGVGDVLNVPVTFPAWSLSRCERQGQIKQAPNLEQPDGMLAY